MIKHLSWQQRLLAQRLCIASLLMFSTIALQLKAIPARQGVMQLLQPDGTIVTSRMYGDEYHHFFTTPEGKPLILEEDGFYRVSDMDTDMYFRSMSEVAQRSPRRRESAKRMRAAKATVSQNGYGLFPGTSFPSVGKPKALVILVEYNDVKFTCPDPAGYFNRMINEPGFSDYGGTGSVLDFFKDNSQGRFEPQFDVFGPVTLPNDMKYYGENGSDGNDHRAYMMVVDAARMLDNQIDFSQYDNDGDGVVDNVFVFFAGEAESSTGVRNQVWPHTYFLKYASPVAIVHDGVSLDRYACSNEWNIPRDIYGKPLPDNPGRPDGIGTFVHEFSHVMGLPDLYSITYNSAFTPGRWSTLDYGPYNNGGCTPPNYSAFERYALGWLQPREISGASNVRLEEISRNQAAIVNTLSPTEFFLFENRQQTGWDAYLPGHGMLVWHIDYNEEVWATNTVNTSASHQYVDLEEADGMKSEETRADDAFPSSLGRTEFNDNTIPSMLPWNGRSLGLPVSEITEREDGVITFKVAGGRPDIAVPKALPATDITPDGFKAMWEASDEPDCSYALSVYTRVSAGNSGMIFVPGFDSLNVGSVTEYSVDGLENNTEYFYTVSVVVKAGESEPSDEVPVRTLPPTFDYLAPVALEAIEIKPTSFTAEWELMPDAVKYYLTVLSPVPDGKLFESYDFADGIAGLPAGWSTTSTSTYAIAGNCGKAVPSLRLTKAGQTLETAQVTDDISVLSFWLRGISTSVGDCVRVEGYSTTDEWKLLREEAMTTAVGGTVVVIDDIPAGIRAIRFTSAHSKGSVAIDDVEVGYGTAYTDKPIDGYDAFDVGNVTSHVVEGLKQDTPYSYFVSAHNGTVESLPSRIMSLRTGVASGVSAPLQSSAHIITDGLTIIASGLEGKTISICDVFGVLVSTSKIIDGTARVAVGTPGFYIIIIDGIAVAKTVVK